MKPEYYDNSRYLEIYDLFSSLDDSEWSKISLNILNDVFKIKILQQEQVYISDIGAGTGFYSYYFLKKNKKYWKNIFFTFVEPSSSMRKILKERIKISPNSSILPYHAEKSLDYMKPQDIFIFQRSLYSFYPNDKFYKYKELVRSLYAKLNTNGMVIVGEIYNKFDIRLLENRIDNNYFYKTNLSKEELIDALSILKQAMLDFNNQIDSGDFTLFGKDKLIQLFLENNFTLEKEISSFLIFKKTIRV